jgi:hypothetical protein
MKINVTKDGRVFVRNSKYVCTINHIEELLDEAKRQFAVFAYKEKQEEDDESTPVFLLIDMD